MNIAVMTFRLHAPWVHSLKEKRMIVKSVVAKLQNRFHVSAAEVDEQDIHRILSQIAYRIQRNINNRILLPVGQQGETNRNLRTESSEKTYVENE